MAHLGETAFELVGEGFQYIGTELGPGFVERHQSSAFAHAASARQVLMERYTCQSVVDGFQFRIVHVVIAIECRSEPIGGVGAVFVQMIVVCSLASVRSLRKIGGVLCLSGHWCARLRPFDAFDAFDSLRAGKLRTGGRDD